MKQYIIIIKMHCTQNRNYCGDCNQSVLPNNYQNQLKSQGHVNIALKNGSTNSMIKKHNIRKDK